MQASIDQVAKRNASFKTGIDVDVERRKREEKQVTIRKEKRDKLLDQRRGGNIQGCSVEESANIVLKKLSSYKKSDLLAGSSNQLELLSQILQYMTKEQAEEHYPALLWNTEGTHPIVIEFLVAKCFVSEWALRALVNATHHKTTYDVSCAIAVLNAKFLEIFSHHITTKTLTSVVQHALLWEVVINLSVCCLEGQLVILKHCTPGGSLPFIELLHEANAHHCGALQSVLIHLAYNLLTNNPGNKNLEAVIRSVPDSWFAQIFAEHLGFLLNDVQPMPFKDLDRSLLSAIGHTTYVLSQCIYFVYNRDKILAPILFTAGLDRVFRHFVALCHNQPLNNQIGLIYLMGRMSMFHEHATQIHEAAHRCHIFKALVFHSGYPDNGKARARAFYSIGEFVHRHYSTMKYIIEAGALPVILETLQRDQNAVRNEALTAMCRIIEICGETRQKDMQYSKEAEMHLETFVFHNLVKFAVSFINSSDIGSTRDALTILLILLQWNKQKVAKEILNANGDSRITIVWSDLKGCNLGTDLYNTICAVEMLMDSANIDAENMDEGLEDEIDLHTNDGKPFFF